MKMLAVDFFNGHFLFKIPNLKSKNRQQAFKVQKIYFFIRNVHRTTMIIYRIIYISYTWPVVSLV